MSLWDEGINAFFAGSFGGNFFNFVQEFDALFVLFFHDTVDSFEEDFVLFHFFDIDIEEFRPFEIIAGSVEIFIGDVYFDEILQAFGGEVFVGVVLEAFQEVDEGLVGVSQLFLDESLDEEEFGAFFTAI